MRKHFPQPRPRQPPANPDICSFTRPFFPPPALQVLHFFPLSHVCQDWPGEQVGRLRQTPHLYPETQIRTWGPTARDPALLTEVEWRGREGGMTKTTACVGEHCLRLRLEIFSGKTGFCTQWSWVWRKGAHIKRSAFMCALLLFFLTAFAWRRSNMLFFSLLGYTVTDWIKEGFPGCPSFLGEWSWYIQDSVQGRNGGSTK